MRQGGSVPPSPISSMQAGREHSCSPSITQQHLRKYFIGKWGTPGLCVQYKTNHSHALNRRRVQASKQTIPMAPTAQSMGKHSP